MTRKLTCNIPGAPYHYDIEIGKDILNSQVPFLKTLSTGVAIVTDDVIAPLYGLELEKTLASSGLKTCLLTFPHGEQHKTRATKEKLEDQLLEKGFGRDTCLIALGGGVVTDIAGFLAATYCRGIPLVMIPTSLLGMVDASVGGKTGVNVPQGKNMIGCIYQPKKVVADLSTLKSLPRRELAEGYVEVIKHGLIADSLLFDDLEENVEKLLSLDFPYVEKVVFESCRIKADIVEHDEREKGKRHLLNFGHTIGHALERLSGYTLTHGEAVAIGIIVESYISLQCGDLDQKSFDRIRNIFIRYGLPLKLPSKYQVSAIIGAMSSDKKSIGGKPRFALIRAIGTPLVHDSSYCITIEEPAIRNALQWMNDDLCSD